MKLCDFGLAIFYLLTTILNALLGANLKIKSNFKVWLLYPNLISWTRSFWHVFMFVQGSLVGITIWGCDKMTNLFTLQK